MINKDMIIRFEQITSKKDEIWYREAVANNTLTIHQLKDGDLEISPASTPETIFWMTDPSGAWRVIVKAVYADEFRKEVVNLGVVETLNMLRKYMSKD